MKNTPFILIISFTLLFSLIKSPSRSQTDQKQRLLVLGDSLTRGLYASAEQHAFKNILADRLDMELGSASGTTLPGLVDLWKTWDWDADYIIIEIGLNDLCQSCAWYLPDEEWEVLLGNFLDDLQLSGAEIVICTMFAAIPADHIQYNQFLQRNEIIRRQAEERNIRVADVYRYTSDCPLCISTPDQASPFAPDFHGDNYHPSDRGHWMIAKAIFYALRHPIYFPNMLYSQSLNR